MAASLPDVSEFNLSKLPPLPRPHLKISFSGGRTSALMTALLLHEYREVRGVPCTVVFANTGQEHEETLKFIDRCDKEWGFNVTWLEAVVIPQKRKGTQSRVVSYETASRDGAPYADGCAKYGIPNKINPWCTRELKMAALHWHMTSRLSLPRTAYTTAIGIRADEIDRSSPNADKHGFVYPLCTLGITKPQVLAWFKRQAFDLQIPEHLGNCTWCWKKSERKLFTVAHDLPAAFDFPARMEALHGNAGALAPRLGPQVFFRGNRSAEEMREQAAAYTGSLYTDPNWDYNAALDMGGACGESCEIGADDCEPDDLPDDAI